MNAQKELSAKKTNRNIDFVAVKRSIPLKLFRLFYAHCSQISLCLRFHLMFSPSVKMNRFVDCLHIKYL